MKNDVFVGVFGDLNRPVSEIQNPEKCTNLSAPKDTHTVAVVSHKTHNACIRTASPAGSYLHEIDGSSIDRQRRRRQLELGG